MGRTKGSLMMFAARGAGALLGLLAIPLYARWLGDAQFGAAIYIQYLAPFFLLIDFGFQEAAQRQISQLQGQDDHEGLWRVHRVHKFTSFVCGAAMAVLCLITAAILKVPRVELSGVDHWMLFIQLAAILGLTVSYQPALCVMVAFERFTEFAKINAVAGLIGTGFSILLTYFWRNANGVIVGLLLTQLLLAMGGAKVCRSIVEGRANPPFWDKPTFWSFGRVAFMDYPNRLLNVVAQNADKILFSTKDGVGQLAVYRKASRLPDAIADLLLMMNGAIFPGWNREYGADPVRFRHGVARILSLILFVAGLALIIPCAFSASLLKIYLGPQYKPELEYVLMFIGVYQAFQVYYTALGYALHVAGRRFVIIPLTALNALVTVVGTIPVYVRFGLTGIAFMNASISLLQLPIAIWLLQHTGMSKRDAFKHFLESVRVAIFLAVFFGVGFALSHVPWIEQRVWTGPLLAIGMMVITLYSAYYLRIVHIPQPVLQRMRVLKPQRPEDSTDA
jgi:O-antigen/teichoic acid export membrane protein